MAFSQRRRSLRVLLPVLGILAIVPAYLRPYRITAGGVSEVPTILPRDTIIVNYAAYHLRFPYSHVPLLHTGSPRRGEMVLVSLPDGRHVAPKRVMGVPGDTIEIRKSRVVVNGQFVPATMLNRAAFAWVPQEAKMGSVIEDENGHWVTYTPGRADDQNAAPVRLGSGRYFVLGDNRDQSADSRTWGPIPEGAVLGRVIVTLPTGARQ